MRSTPVLTQGLLTVIINSSKERILRKCKIKIKTEKEVRRIYLLASGSNPEIQQGPNFTEKDTQLWKA